MRLTPFLRHINENGAQFGFALIEDPDDVRWFRWTGSSYALAGGETCSTFSFCGGNET